MAFRKNASIIESFSPMVHIMKGIYLNPFVEFGSYIWYAMSHLKLELFLLVYCILLFKMCENIWL
ncbi:hypothetical protein ACA30_06155 [Virgibacillus soli]|uniref:Uncharacterized protein n=1 Tax=Lederbergia galactosidilytica TaxID=217031 RepID=A0A0Q9Y2V4_9BACI|nr:hypothetical protein ACA29_13080 [Lederbergia galactosidilytica]KRG15432.1 hypothetical protein ACA30_06155 [Virgibacillus soli]OAK75844.1 hypothetical protein ABB05_00165 [Lederbergia galactosidilytica]